jgi:hypothetical protein
VISAQANAGSCDLNFFLFVFQTKTIMASAALPLNDDETERRELEKRRTMDARMLTSPRKSMSCRRKSRRFAKTGQQIAELYADCLKLSTENVSSTIFQQGIFNTPWHFHFVFSP